MVVVVAVVVGILVVGGGVVVVGRRFLEFGSPKADLRRSFAFTIRSVVTISYFKDLSVPQCPSLDFSKECSGPLTPNSPVASHQISWEFFHQQHPSL